MSKKSFKTIILSLFTSMLLVTSSFNVVSAKTDSSESPQFQQDRREVAANEL